MPTNVLILFLSEKKIPLQILKKNKEFHTGFSLLLLQTFADFSASIFD
jgi:hypothetical protein